MDDPKMQKRMEVSDVFNPGSPVSDYTLFAGRTQQLGSVIDAINQDGMHAIIYGERGVGKTSLANVLSKFFEARYEDRKWLRYVRVNCDTEESYSSLWHKIFGEMRLVYQKKKIGFTGEEETETVSLEGLLPEDPRPEDLRRAYEQLGGLHIIAIDELDRVSDQRTTTMLADTVKTFSDHALPVSILFVGVADSVDELIREHESIERSLAQIHMPRMSRGELQEILDKSLGAISMGVTERASNKITHLSQGLPHYTHLLGLHATVMAVNDGRQQVEEVDVDNAIEHAVEQAQRSIITRYHRATSSARETIYEEVLLACALAESDELGYFASSDVREPLSRLMGKRYDIPAFSRHLNDFCESRRGPLLRKIGRPRSYRFRFLNPLMAPFVIMKGLESGLIDMSYLGL